MNKGFNNQQSRFQWIALFVLLIWPGHEPIPQDIPYWSIFKCLLSEGANPPCMIMIDLQNLN